MNLTKYGYKETNLKISIKNMKTKLLKFWSSHQLKKKYFKINQIQKVVDEMIAIELDNLRLEHGIKKGKTKTK